MGFGTASVFDDSDQSQSPWTFVVIGDTQDSVMNTKTGINPFLPVLFREIAKEKPDFVIHAGDCISGEYTSDDSPVQGDFHTMYDNFVAAATPVYNYSSHSGTPIYTVRGNHDNGNRYEGNESLKAAYLETVGRDLPSNGPEGETRLSYFFSHKGALFIGIDEYLPHRGKTATVNQEWIDTVLADTLTPFTFVWGHSPAFPLGHGIDPYALSLFPEERDAFWKSLTDHKVPLYFCGHSHLYCRGEKDGVWQIICGTGGGAPSGFAPGAGDPMLNISYPQIPVPERDQGIGYLLMTVDSVNGTVKGDQKQYNAINNHWEEKDSFLLTVTKKQGLPVPYAHNIHNSLILLLLFI